MENKNFYKHAGFALVAAALALSASAARASDQQSWVWEDQGNHRVAVVRPAPDVVYRSAPYRIVISRFAARRVIYSPPAVRKVVYRKPTLFSPGRSVWVFDPAASYLPVSGSYVQKIGYLEYR